MRPLGRRSFIKTASSTLAASHLLPCSWALAAAAPERDDKILWFDKPASQWVDALPIGSGMLGAMVFGGSEMGDATEELLVRPP